MSYYLIFIFLEIILSMTENTISKKQLTHTCINEMNQRHAIEEFKTEMGLFENKISPTNNQKEFISKVNR